MHNILLGYLRYASTTLSFLRNENCVVFYISWIRRQHTNNNSGFEKTKTKKEKTYTYKTYSHNAKTVHVYGKEQKQLVVIT